MVLQSARRYSSKRLVVALVPLLIRKPLFVPFQLMLQIDKAQSA